MSSLFLSSIFFFVSKYSSITLIDVISNNLFSPIFPNCDFRLANLLFSRSDNSMRCSSCPSSHESKNSFPLKVIFTFAIYQFPQAEYLFLDLIHLFFQKIVLLWNFPLFFFFYKPEILL